MSSDDPAPANPLTVVLRSHRSEVERLWTIVEGFGEAQQLSADDTASINLVLDEVVINVIKYGYDGADDHAIRVTLERQADTVIVEVEDEAKPFNPLDVPPPNLDLPIEERPIGGLGIFIVRSTMTNVEYRRDNGRNILTMRKTVGA